MNKRCERKLDLILWFIILLLPIIFFVGQYLMYDLTEVADIGSFGDFIVANFGVLTDNIVYSTFADIFGSSGVFPIFNTTGVNAVLVYLTYMLIIEIIHAVYDFLVLIPRLSHKWLHQISKDD